MDSGMKADDVQIWKYWLVSSPKKSISEITYYHPLLAINNVKAMPHSGRSHTRAVNGINSLVLLSLAVVGAQVAVSGKIGTELRLCGSRSRIFDCFLYHTEAYMLFLRLTLLHNKVDYFVIGFCERAFADPTVHRPFSLYPFQQEILQFHEKIVWVNLTLSVTGPLDRSRFRGKELAWRREATVRNHLIDGLAKLGPADDDLILLSDVDEIPYPKAIDWIKENPPLHYYNLYGDLFHGTLRWRVDEWTRPLVIRYPPLVPLNEYKFLRHTITRRVPMHLHCSFCFPTVQQVIAKLRAFSHTEFSSGKYLDPAYLTASLLCGNGIVPMEKPLPNGTLVIPRAVLVNISSDTGMDGMLLDKRLQWLTSPIGWSDVPRDFARIDEWAKKMDCPSHTYLPLLQDSVIQIPRN